MEELKTQTLGAQPRAFLRTAVHVAGISALALLVSLSAMVIKHARSRGGAGLAVLAEVEPAGPATVLPPAVDRDNVSIIDPLAAAPAAVSDVRFDEPAPATDAAGAPAQEYPLDTRWFDGRPVRPAGTIMMTVTAYSPDARSCGDSADGITSSLHSVWTNGMKLVAADSRVLPLGSMVSVPGYDDGKVVPVLDRGGAIKGKRLDVLYPTHEEARAWGVRKIPVVVWEYADGKPAGNWRNTRDSR